MASSTSPAPPNPNPWAPYDTYKDCSQGICSIYCPQWCYIIFPPPPPFSLEDADSSTTDFSPLIIAIIGILASAFILVSYYTIISKYCRRRSHDHDHDRDATSGGSQFHENTNNDSNWQHNNGGGGLDESLIKSITVCKYYKKGDHDSLVEGTTDCSVCLSEFQEGESLRLLPKCNHVFHLPCIDTWFKSHSNCPLCRANVVASSTNMHQTPSPPPPPAAAVAATTVNQYQHRNETVLVIQELETTAVREQAVVMNLVGNDDDGDDVVVRQNTSDQVGVGVQEIRRSVSLNSCQVPVLIADILSSNEEEEEEEEEDGGGGGDYNNQMEKNRSNRVLNLVRNTPLAFKRSVSTGRFIFTRYAKSGNDSIIPN